MHAMKAYRKNRGIAPLIPHRDKVKELRMYRKITNHLNMCQTSNDWERH
jgi:hypothetical protein